MVPQQKPSVEQGPPLCLKAAKTKTGRNKHTAEAARFKTDLRKDFQELTVAYCRTQITGNSGGKENRSSPLSASVAEVWLPGHGLLGNRPSRGSRASEELSEEELHGPRKD